MSALGGYAARVEQYLNARYPEAVAKPPRAGEIPWLLYDAMRYSLMAGGKRLRPSLMLATADMLGADLEEVLPSACALELIHTCSLIHDDLPAMDDDDLRRGKPTCHVMFGEGQAVLAGDALFNASYELLLENALAHPGRERLHMLAMNEIATAAGPSGMVGGQALDLHCERRGIKSEEMLAVIDDGKTARLLVAPVRAAGRLAGLNEEELAPLTRFAEKYGQLFQATDDLLDAKGDEKLVGKRLGKDADKLTYVTLLGVPRAAERAGALALEAKEALSVYGERAATLLALVDETLNRAY